jgi:hypothetical protein
VEGRFKLLLLLPLLAVGLVSFVVVRTQQGEGGGLVVLQQHARTLTPEAVARVVRFAPDPLSGARGLRASCVARGSGDLHNPWSCTISYPSGRVINYRIMLTANGSYSGDDQIGYYHGRRYKNPGQITGCCVAIP